MVVPRKILLPYSLLSVVQDSQDEEFDEEIGFFHPSDYYKLRGRTLLHKLKNKHHLL